ncbi:MAG: S9 family peptidase [Balneolales bacterium]
MYRHHIIITTLLFVICLTATAQDGQPFESLEEALFSAGQLRGSTGPQSVNWIDDGDRYSYLAQNPDTERQEIRSFDPETLEDELIFDGEGITFPDSDEPFDYHSFEWADDSRHILFQSNFRPIYRHSGISDYYFYSLEDQSLQPVAMDAGSAELSPDGSMIGFERGGNIFVYRFDTDEEVQLTHDAEEHIFNGRFGWVYEEEFMIAQAWSWSPDNRKIAFWQEDEREVPVFQMTDYSGQHADYVKIRYPKVGDVNPKVRIGVVDVGSKERIWLDHGETEDSYIPRIYWTSDTNRLAMVHLNRKQNHLKLFFFDTASGERQLVMEEQSEYWIDIFNFFEGIDDLFFFPDDRREFFWISDRDGYRHLYRYDYDGSIVNQVTEGNWNVTNVQTVDNSNEVIYFTSTEVSPLERHLFQTDFTGNNKKRLSEPEGRHTFNMSPNGRFYIDSYSNLDQPMQVELWSSGGEQLKVLEDNQIVSDFTDYIAYARSRLQQFTSSDGQQLDYRITKPHDFDESKSYPLLLDVYGGPGAQSVYNQFGGNAWHQYLAQQGYIIAEVNNRGSGGYDRVFEKIVYKDLGRWEAFDFMETAKHLSEKDYIDEDRIAIRGHSYGGYMAAYTLLAYPELFKVGIATAPITDWRLYDTIYSERYMGLLKENEGGYESSALTQMAAGLEGKLLLAHSAMDENVHMQHTMQLIKALTDAGKDADLRIYPPGAHGVSYNTPSYILLFRVYTDYLMEHL